MDSQNNLEFPPPTEKAVVIATILEAWRRNEGQSDYEMISPAGRMVVPTLSYVITSRPNGCSARLEYITRNLVRRDPINIQSYFIRSNQFFFTRSRNQVTFRGLSLNFDCDLISDSNKIVSCTLKVIFKYTYEALVFIRALMQYIGEPATCVGDDHVLRSIHRHEPLMLTSVGPGHPLAINRFLETGPQEVHVFRRKLFARCLKLAIAPLRRPGLCDQHRRWTLDRHINLNILKTFLFTNSRNIVINTFNEFYQTREEFSELQLDPITALFEPPFDRPSSYIFSADGIVPGAITQYLLKDKYMMSGVGYEKLRNLYMDLTNHQLSTGGMVQPTWCILFPFRSGMLWAMIDLSPDVLRTPQVSVSKTQGWSQYSGEVTPIVVIMTSALADRVEDGELAVEGRWFRYYVLDFNPETSKLELPNSTFRPTDVSWGYAFWESEKNEPTTTES